MPAGAAAAFYSPMKPQDSKMMGRRGGPKLPEAAVANAAVNLALKKGREGSENESSKPL
jgi:hypothetical protein